MYTREMHRQYEAAEQSARLAETALRPLRAARNDHLNALGDMLLKCPQQAGTHGAANFAIQRADKLTEMLAPFVSVSALFDPRDAEIATLRATITRLTDASEGATEL